MPEDQGLVMPWSTDDGEASCAFHLECFLDSVVHRS